MNDQPRRVTSSAPLHEVAGFPTLVRDWLSDEATDPAATLSWRAALAAENSGEPAPAWRDDAWRSSWWEDFAADLPDDASREKARANVDRLVAGEADVIVTGQQPGFLGGPLYTLFKIATCVAAAAARTSAGQPTVPVFWMGDDDDDLREAFAPTLYDPGRGALLSARLPDLDASTTVGSLPVATVGAAEEAWLAERATDEPLAGVLAALWREARAEGLSWGRLQRRVLCTLFGADGLLVVSGDDPALHAAAAPIYKILRRDQGRLADLAAECGTALIEQGYHAQIGESSLANPFSVSDHDRRLRLGSDETVPADACRLRPGVLFRSPVQDWLFQPAAVVVGPGELSYLTQLAPVYDALDLPRCPLLPRLFAMLRRQQDVLHRSEDNGENPHADILARLDGESAHALAIAVDAAFGSRDEDVERLVKAALDAGSERHRALFARLSKTRAPGKDAPAWLAPAGRRQERVMAMDWALAVWGRDLVDQVLEAARLHLEAGLTGDWRDWQLIVDGTRCEGTSQ
jgi:hypothetical protein